MPSFGVCQRARWYRAVLLVVGSAIAVAAADGCRSRGELQPGEGQAEEPEKLSALCGKDVGTSSREHIGWLEADATDVTQQFHELLARVRAGEEVVPDEADKYIWVLAPGLFGDTYPDYMRGNIAALRDLDLRYRVGELAPDETLESGARGLRETILEATAGGEQVVILGHSKGAVDAAAALALYPELRARVRALVAIQAPYAGTPVASDLAHCPAMGDLAEGMLGILGENPHAVVELSYDTRREFLSKHPYPKGIPTLCLATSRVDWRSIVAMTGYYVRNRYGVESDGLVVPADAVIPGSRVVYLDDMDHAEAILTGVPGFINYRPREVTLVLVAMALAE